MRADRKRRLAKLEAQAKPAVEPPVRIIVDIGETEAEALRRACGEGVNSGSLILRTIVSPLLGPDVALLAQEA